MTIAEGKSYRTRGGWKAKVIHVGPPMNSTCIGRDTFGKFPCVIAIHANPDMRENTLMVDCHYKAEEVAYHTLEGKAVPAANVGVLPPTFGREILHPADLIEEI